MKIKIIYPENKWVSEDKIRGWYRDAVANKEVDRTDLDSTDCMAYELENSGLITIEQIDYWA